MESSNLSLNEIQIQSLCDIFIELYKDGIYSVEENEKTPAQRKTLRCSFRKELRNAKFSQYFVCLFQGLIESDTKKVIEKNRKIKELKKQNEEYKKDMEIKLSLERNEMRREIRQELITTDFREMSETNDRLRKRLNEYANRIEQKNAQIDYLKVDSQNYVPRADYNTLESEYLALKVIKSDKQTAEDKEKEKHRKKKKARLDALLKKKEEEEAELVALQKELYDDEENVEINISDSSSSEED